VDYDLTIGINWGANVAQSGPLDESGKILRLLCAPQKAEGCDACEGKGRGHMPAEKPKRARKLVLGKRRRELCLPVFGNREANQGRSDQKNGGHHAPLADPMNGDAQGQADEGTGHQNFLAPPGVGSEVRRDVSQPGKQCETKGGENSNGVFHD